MSEFEPNLSDKLREYREMAAEAWKAAKQAATPEIKRSHEELARAWEQLIKEIELLIRGGAP